MTLKDLKPGMKVWIRDWEKDEIYRGCSFADEMLKIKGIQTIVEVHEETESFTLANDDWWHFCPEMVDWDRTKELNRKEEE